MQDFTLKEYKNLLAELTEAKYKFIKCAEFMEINPGKDKLVILRHDVDRKPGKALKMAVIESSLKINSIHYFRVTSECLNPKIIKQISAMGHEIGYHYENLAYTARKLKIGKGDLQRISHLLKNALKNEMGKRKNEKGEFVYSLHGLDEQIKKTTNSLFAAGIEDFERNLIKLRKMVPIETISMHGSPMSEIDNRLLWLKYDYRDYGIKFEPYFDLDFDEFYYITDASRRWNDTIANKRDNVKSKYNISLDSVSEITRLAKSNTLPDKIMINIHPHNWSGNYPDWLRTKLGQGLKNIIKSKISR